MIEFVDGWPSRQVEQYGDRWLATSPTLTSGPISLADQPLAEMDLADEDAISEEEFERAWVRATST